MDVVPSNFMPGDPRLIDQIVYELKSQGIFDQFRKECIADVDTKPAYQNLRQRVEGNVTSFLAKQKWSEDLNKNQLREQLRKHISESGWLERGVERIVDQVVNPKINTVFMPKVEDVYRTFLGIEKPIKEEQAKDNEKKEKQPENVDVTDKPGGSGSESMDVDMLPKDLEAVSPESNKEVSLNNTEEKHAAEPINADGESHDSSSTTAKTEDEESPPFEPLDDVSPSSIKYSPKEEISDDSQESGLTSHNTSFEQKPPTPVDLSQEISLTSSDTKVSSNDSTKMEICETEDEASLEKLEEVQKEAEKVGNTREDQNVKNDKVEVEKEDDKKKLFEFDEKSEKDIKCKSDEKEKKHVEKEKKSVKKDKKSSKHEKDKKDEKRSKDSSHFKERSSSKHSHSSSKDKEKKSERESRKDDIKDKDSKKDDAQIKESKDKDKEHSRDKDKLKDKSHKERDSHKHDKDKRKSSTDRSDKDRLSKDKESSKKDDRERHRSSSHKGKDKERNKEDKKESEKDKHKLSREKSSTSIKDSPSKSKDSSKKHKDSSRDKEKTNTKDKSEKNSKEKDGDKDKSKSSENKKDKSKSDHKDKKLGDEKHRSSEKHKKSDRDKSSDHRKSTSSKKDKDKKSKDDHYSLKEKRNDRRSTDRDSNDGSSKSSRNGSFNDGSWSQSGRVGKSSSNRLFDSSTSGDSSGGTSDNVEGHTENLGEYIEEIEVFEHEVAEHEFVNHSNKETIVVEHQCDNLVGEVEIGGQDVEEEVVQQGLVEAEAVVEAKTLVKTEIAIKQPPPIKFIKPKFASNMQEAMRIMKIRKQLVELEKQANSTLQNLTSPKINIDNNDKTEAQAQKNDSVETSVNLDDIEAPVPSIKFIKPKFASNMKEAMRLMKIRKKLAQLEKEHQQALAELRKRRENTAQNELNVEEVEIVVRAASPEQKQIESKSTAAHKKSEKRFIDELPDDEPLLQSIDLSSEKFAELEAKLALEMANIDFSSYDIPSDEEEEYQSIVISPKKSKHKISEDYKNKDNVPVENKTEKSFNDSSRLSKPVKKSVSVKVELTKKNNKTDQDVSDKSNVTKTKDVKLISQLAKTTGPVKKKNNAISKINKNKVKVHIQKPKNKINSKTQNLNDVKLNTIKKHIIISVKQDLCNGFPESKNTNLELNKKVLGPSSFLIRTEKENNLSPEKGNGKTGLHNHDGVLEIKKDTEKILFVNLINADQKIKEKEIEQIRRESVEKTKEIDDCENASTSTDDTDQSELIENIEEVQNTLKLDKPKSEISENISGKQDGKVTVAINDKKTSIEATNTKIHVTATTAPESQSIVWESEDSPCYYFTPVKDNWEKQLSMLSQFISYLENKIEQDSLLIAQDVVPKKKVVRKRKLGTDASTNEAKAMSPDVKRQRQNSTSDKKEVNNLMLNDEAGFSLPLSPAQSDEADVKKEEPPVIVAQPKRRVGRASIGKRYDSSDLYKPRPVISRGSSRRSMASDKS